jgi:small subunit ribosomal protein S7e
MVRELEKKYSGKDVLILPNRCILPEAKSGSLNHRSSTLTSVYDAILEDILYPLQIIGKRIRYRNDGSKFLKIYLDRKEWSNLKHKLTTYTKAYKKITGKNINFDHCL